MNKLSISAYIISKNAEATIEKVLASLDFCDEIVVVDSGSTDKTYEICKRYNVKWFHQDFLGYGKQKRFASSQTKNSWVINVDADEVVTLDLSKFLLQKFESEVISKFSAISIPIKNIFMGRLISFWGDTSEGHVRIYDKTKCEFDEAHVHEIVKTSGNVLEIPFYLDHYSYQSLHHYFEKFNTYTTLAAAKDSTKNLSKFSIAFRPFFTFFNLYFLRGGFKNGWPGFVWCMCSGFYPFVKYAKMIELHETKE